MIERSSDDEDREALSDFLFSIYDHGTQPSALREADAILTFLAARSPQPAPSVSAEQVTAVTARPSDADLAQIKAREQAATEGPWKAYFGQVSTVARAATSTRRAEPSQEICDPGNEDDAEFIAHARTDVPVLLREEEALRAERDTARAAVEAVADAVLARHVRSGRVRDDTWEPDGYCLECDLGWPCPDVRAVAAAGYPTETEEGER